MADELRISDWISDVCSSDLEARARAPGGTATGPAPRLDCRPPRPRIRFMVWLYLLLALAAFAVALKSTSIALAVVCLPAALGFLEIGRASCRERVCQEVYVSGDASLIKKNISKEMFH